MNRSQITFINHILENIENIEAFSKDITKEELLKDKQKQYAIVRAIEIVGEAAKNISSSFKEKHPEVPWREVIGTRDRIIHRYFGVDLDVIWDIIKKNIPELKKKVQGILERSSLNASM